MPRVAIIPNHTTACAVELHRYDETDGGLFFVFRHPIAAWEITETASGELVSTPILPWYACEKNCATEFEGSFSHPAGIADNLAQLAVQMELVK